MNERRRFWLFKKCNKRRKLHNQRHWLKPKLREDLKNLFGHRNAKWLIRLSKTYT
jgi:hypothetical protein